MADYDFRTFSALVAEDNSYLRTLLSNSLRAIGVGNVRTVNDGGEAIEVLQNVKTNPMKAGMQQVDVILSNWQMHPTDGLMLLRWVRRHKESPCRFVPFVMVTGYADQDKVNEARTLGVTEMLAKP
ncbi:MAG: response regulator, partial [Alphaproteobacteria bacterium]|nr:response regulator [Alphaproteobacteria bacterium]